MKCIEFLYFYLLDETPASGTVVTVGRQEKWRTTEEKKELLGTMLGLGIVNEFFEGIRKVGVYGVD